GRNHDVETLPANHAARGLEEVARVLEGNWHRRWCYVQRRLRADEARTAPDGAPVLDRLRARRPGARLEQLKVLRLQFRERDTSREHHDRCVRRPPVHRECSWGKRDPPGRAENSVFTRQPEAGIIRPAAAAEREI